MKKYQKGFAPIIILLFVAIAVYAGYFILKYNKPITIPSITPPSSPEPTLDWKTYTNLTGKYSFKYDPSISTPQNSEKDVVLDLSGNKLIISTEPTMLTLNEYIDQKTWCTSISSTKGYSYLLDSEKSLRFDKTPCGLVGSTDIYSLHDGISYHINIGTQSNFGDIEPIFDQILSTFKFTDSSSDVKYSCPENGWVNCMPILTPDAQKACSKEALDWYKANCPNFQGAAL